MAFPTSPSDNQIYKIGNRAWVYDSTLGVWDQVADNDTDASNLSGTLGAGVTVIMHRFKEHSRFLHPTSTSTTSTSQNTINISGTKSVNLTPEDTGDVFEFGWAMMSYSNGGYFGFGVQRATTPDFVTGAATVWSNGQHASGRHGHSADYGSYEPQTGSVSATAAGLTVGTTYYFRMIGMTHSIGGTFGWGGGTASHTNGSGVIMDAKRWSIV